MPPTHPARARRPKQPNWSVTIDGRSREVTKGSGKYASKDTVISDVEVVDLTLRDDDGNVYVAKLHKRHRKNWYSLSSRGMAHSHKEMSKKPRASVSMSDNVEFHFVEPLKGVADFPQYPDLEYMNTSRGDYPDVDKEFDRFNGQRVAAERMLLKWLMPLIDAELSKARFDWSNYAGCSCPCSPGFIVSNVRRHDRVDYDLWIMSRDEKIVRDEQIAAATRERKEKERKEKAAKAERLLEEAALLQHELANA
jgi:hypothetical protein